MMCPVCTTGELYSLGDLGSRRHYRCRACGVECSEEVEREVTCAICTEPGPASSMAREPLGIGGALVNVCADCNTRDAGDGYAFSTSSRTGGGGLHAPVGSGNKRKGAR